MKLYKLLHLPGVMRTFEMITKLCYGQNMQNILIILVINLIQFSALYAFKA